jgi:hypothetical protein
MADKFLFSNNAKSTLASGITAVATSIFLQVGDGALFPSPGTGERFAVTLVDASGNIEIAHCTSRTVDTLTVVRAQEGTTGIVFASGDIIELRLTKGALDEFNQRTVDTPIPASTNMLFNQSSAPTGWTQDASQNDRVIRIVSGAGAGTGGSWTISGVSVDSHTLTESEIPAHDHGSAGGHTHGLDLYGFSGGPSVTEATFDSDGTYTGTVNTNSNGAHTHSSFGGGGGHTHGLTIGSAWRPAYRDVIACTKNAY